MEDRGRLRGAPGRRLPIELVVEDGFDGAVGPGADLDGALGGGFETLGAEGPGEADDAQTGAIALLGMGPAFEDLLAQRRGRRADLAGVFADALDRPAGVAPVARGHVLGKGGVLPVPARPYMDGDALALVEDLDAAGGHPRLDLGAGEAVGDGIIVGVDLDVIVDADPGQAPLAVFVGARPASAFSAGRSISSSNWRRVTPSLRRGWRSLSWVMSSPSAASTSARL